jgi:hypothetical protein
MAYNFGNIFVQAMENQKRLATQRQQFDQQMSFQRDQAAQQESKFARSHELDTQRAGYEGERVGFERSREDREASIDRGRQFQTPEQRAAFERTVGIPEGTVGPEVRFTDLPNLLHPILQREDLNWRKSTTGGYWGDKAGGWNFVQAGGKVPEGHQPSVEQAVDIQTRADIDALTQEIQPQLRGINIRPEPQNFGATLDTAATVLSKLKGIDTSRLTPDQRDALGLSDLSAALVYMSEALHPETGNKALIRQLGKKEAHELLLKTLDQRRALTNMSVPLPENVYVPPYQEPGINLRELFQTGEGGLLDRTQEAEEARARANIIGGRR